MSCSPPSATERLARALTRGLRRDYVNTVNKPVPALDRLGIERAHLVGWSMGGGVALEMAGLAPEP